METNKTKIVSLKNTHPALEERNKILIYTRDKFYKEGFYKTSMDEIAGELHVSKKTIYKYFPSKDNLIKEICSHTTKELINVVDKIVDGKEDVVLKFIKLMNMYGGFLSGVSDKWFNDISIHAPKLKKDIEVKRNEKIVFIMKKLLEQGKKEKLIVNYPTDLIIQIFISSLKSALNSDFLIMSRFSMSDAFRQTYEILLNGILTNKGKEKYSREKQKLSKYLLV